MLDTIIHFSCGFGPLDKDNHDAMESARNKVQKLEAAARRLGFANFSADEEALDYRDVRGTHPTIGSDEPARALYEKEYNAVNPGGAYWNSLPNEVHDRYRKRVGAPPFDVESIS